MRDKTDNGYLLVTTKAEKLSKDIGVEIFSTFIYDLHEVNDVQLPKLKDTVSAGDTETQAFAFHKQLVEEYASEER